MTDENKMIKFTPEEEQKIFQLRELLQKIIFDFGQLHIESMQLADEKAQLAAAEANLKMRENQLRNNYIQQQAEQGKFMEAIHQHYGDGEYDTESRTFVPKNKKL